MNEEKKIPAPTTFPIAFRAFDLQNKRMITPEELEELMIVVSPTGKVYQGNGREAMQLKLSYFSGMKCSKGKPLFTGDICKIGVRLHPTLPSLVEKWARVAWIPQRTCFTLQIVDPNKDTMFEVKEVELMGNEDENPELLENLLK